MISAWLSSHCARFLITSLSSGMISSANDMAARRSTSYAVRLSPLDFSVALIHAFPIRCTSRLNPRNKTIINDLVHADSVEDFGALPLHERIRERLCEMINHVTMT